MKVPTLAKACVMKVWWNWEHLEEQIGTPKRNAPLPKPKRKSIGPMLSLFISYMKIMFLNYFSPFST